MKGTAEKAQKQREKRKHSKMARLAAGLSFCLLFSVFLPVQAEEVPLEQGWKQQDNIWYFYKNGEKIENRWAWIDGQWYYFEEDGAMKTGWLLEDGIWYYLKPSGEMAWGWLQDEGVWFYLLKNGAMKTGWLETGGHWYYFSRFGDMLEDQWVCWKISGCAGSRSGIICSTMEPWPQTSGFTPLKIGKHIM